MSRVRRGVLWVVVIGGLGVAVAQRYGFSYRDVQSEIVGAVNSLQKRAEVGEGAPSVGGRVYRYVGADGTVHYVDSLDKIPLAARGRSSAPHQLPTLAPSGGTERVMVEIYVASWCGYCTALETQLRREGIQYRKYDIEDGGRGAELFRRYGNRVHPLVIVGSTKLHGHDVEAVKQAVRRGAL